MTTTIFLSVSRDEHLDRVFAALELMRCDAAQVALLAYVDGDAALTELTTKYVAASRFAERRTVQRPPDNGFRHYDIRRRRERIAAIKNESRALIRPCQYVLSVEDDTIVPPHTLERLSQVMTEHPFAGFVEGVELGRWGVPYVGAWSADDVYEPTRLSTLLPPAAMSGTSMSQSPAQEIDAGGFYCYLTRREVYVGHEYRSFEGGALGPDVEFGLAMRREGRQCYVDWSVWCEHRGAIGGTDRAVTLAMTRQPSGDWSLVL